MPSLFNWFKNHYITWRFSFEFQRILSMQPGARFLRMKQLGFDLAEQSADREVYRHKGGAEISFCIE